MHLTIMAHTHSIVRHRQQYNSTLWARFNYSHPGWMDGWDACDSDGNSIFYHENIKDTFLYYLLLWTEYYPEFGILFVLQIKFINIRD